MAAEQNPLLISRVSPWVNPYEYIVSTNQGDFVYVPQDVVNKGYVKEENAGFIQNADGTFGIKKEKRQYFHPELLKQDLLSSAGRIKIDENLFTDAQKSEMSSLIGKDINTGYLFPAVKYIETVRDPFFYTLDEDSPPISGVSSLSNQGVGGTAFDSGYKYILGTPTSNNFDFINPDASINTLTTTYTPPKKRGGILGSAARSIVNVIADIPYLPEIAAFATGSPVLYGSLKAAQTAAAGGDLEDTIKSGVVSGGTMWLGQQVLGPVDATAGGVEPGGLPSDYNVDPFGPGGEVVPDTGGFPSNYNVEPYGPGGIVPPQPVDMGLGSGIKATLPPLPDEGLLGTTTTPDYSTSPQTIPGSDGGQVLKPPTMPSVGGLGGAQGVTVPIPGGTVGQFGVTPTGATPVLGDPGSFINDPNVLGTDVIGQGTPSGISARDAARAARSAYNLLNPAGAGGEGVDQGGAQQPTAGVDYSGLYNLLAQRALAGGLLGTRYQPQPVNLASLLG